MRRPLTMQLPIIQAPMAGVSTPALAAAVSNAGALGSIGLGAVDAHGGRAMIEAVRALTDKPFNVNLFVHGPAKADAEREAAWLQALKPLFAEFGAAPPAALRTIYKSFAHDDDMLRMLIELAPPVISLHFGLPAADRLQALRATGATLLATATSLDEARKIQDAGIDMVVAQGIEAGGHRGVFDPMAADENLSTFTLTRLLVEKIDLPVIAAGGIMDGAGISAVLRIGAVAAQMGTAFVLCPESSADEAYRKALAGPRAAHTVMTALISGRPARSLVNRFTALEAKLGRANLPDYPIAYDAGKALNAAAKLKGEHGFGAQWAGQGAPLARALPAAELVETLVHELRASEEGGHTHIA